MYRRPPRSTRTYTLFPYTTLFRSAASLRKGRRVYLDLGRVEVLSGVTVNGKDLGVTWKEPYRVDITDVVRAGANSVSLAVTNLWANRMIADAAPTAECTFGVAVGPVGERFTTAEIGITARRGSRCQYVKYMVVAGTGTTIINSISICK